jgi:hypothetical protein
MTKDPEKTIGGLLQVYELRFYTASKVDAGDAAWVRAREAKVALVNAVKVLQVARRELETQVVELQAQNSRLNKENRELAEIALSMRPKIPMEGVVR